MPKSVSTLTLKEVEANIKKLVDKAKATHLKKAYLFVGGCVGGCIALTFYWDGDNLKSIRKAWTVRYTLNGTKKETTFGTYGDKDSLSLPEFRQKVNDFQKQTKDGVDVVADKKQQRKAEITNSRTFGEVASEWLKIKKSELSPATFKKLMVRYNCYFKQLEAVPITSINRQKVVEFLSQFNDKGATRDKLIITGNGIFKLAIIKEYITSNPFNDITMVLPRRPDVKHMATLTDPTEIGDLMRKLYAEKPKNPFLVGLALFSIFTLARQQEVRFTTWEQIDIEKRLWTIPASIMKTRREHIVPLSLGAMLVLTEMKDLLPKNNAYVFPSCGVDKPFSDGACLELLRRIGYSKEQIVPHGFRAMGSTQLNELNFPRDWVDLSLAHSIGNDISQAYNHSLLLEQRRQMLEAWYLYLCDLRDGKDIKETKAKYSFKY